MLKSGSGGIKLGLKEGLVAVFIDKPNGYLIGLLFSVGLLGSAESLRDFQQTQSAVTGPVINPDSLDHKRSVATHFNSIQSFTEECVLKPTV